MERAVDTALREALPRTFYFSTPDTLFPLNAALGYDIAQNLFIGRRNVLVEGVSEFIYLTAISGHLANNGKPGLPIDCRLVPAGGAANIPTFLALPRHPPRRRCSPRRQHQ